MRRSDSGRPILFALAVSALIGSALLTGLSGGDGAVPAARRPASPQAAGLIRPGPPANPPPSNDRRAALATARAFLAAYLRYEAGDLGPTVARALRTRATPEFAAALLGEPPHSTGGSRLPAPARLRRFRVRFVPGSREWAALSARAERGDRTERLSFVLGRRGGRWLITGVGE